MYNVKTKAIPVTVGETGTISEPFRQYLSNTEGKHEIKELRKEPYWALHILRKVLVQKCGTFNMGNSITCNIN
jgi:hypothetical protein